MEAAEKEVRILLHAMLPNVQANMAAWLVARRNKKSLLPERVPGICNVRPDTSDTGETALFPEQE